jgi:hypothetical protein
MRAGFVLLALLLSPATGVACDWPFVGIGSEASRDDRRELEQLLGTQLDHVACGSMQRIRLYTSSLTLRRGFFVLTEDEAVFVKDGRTKEVRFRTAFTWVRYGARSVFGDTQYLIVAIDDAEFRFAFDCDGVARAAIDEFERRTAPRTRAVPVGSGSVSSCN